MPALEGAPGSNQTLRILIDANMSTHWVATLRNMGHEVLHWREIGSETAPDDAIMDWARTNQFIILTQDLDFGILLARGRHRNPSVVQLRVPETLTEASVAAMRELLDSFRYVLLEGAFVSIDSNRNRVRILPLDAS
jgi:predicted nuclease of predicted toxin-antitoxin system